MILNEFLNILKNGKESIAYTVDDKSYTYQDLYKYVCNIYEFILMENKENKPIIIYGHKQVYMKACFLACSFAGITYVPIDENAPKERINQIIEQIEPKIIIGDIKIYNIKTISEFEIEKIMNKIDFKEINQIYMKPDDIYYILFTSGTTGIPKGVQVTYKNVDSCINWLKEITNIQKEEIVLNQVVFSFDVSLPDLYLSLITVSEQYIIPDKNKMDFNSIFGSLKNSNATFAVFTPSFADLLLIDKSFGKEILPNLKTILFCGEKLLSSTVKKLFERFDNINIINSYGPTECTYAVTSIKINKDLLNNELLPAGIPKEDVQIFIVNEEKKELNEGEIGEILITGDSVSKGYIGLPENKSFIGFNGKRGYLTGDYGYIKNGILYCKGRKDKQIKYKGYRIELQDIEQNLEKLDYIEKAVVLFTNKLIAFVKTKKDIDILTIKKDLLEKIPEYMCPIIKIVDKFPLNNNGKCDEKKLLEEC